MRRSSGILMHISSLPGDFGIGTLGEKAYDFIDFLKASGQSYWQILPLGQTSYGDSPYQSFSAFAGNPYFIDFNLLKDEGLLKEDDYINESYGANRESIDYALLFTVKYKILNKAYKNFNKDDFKDYEEFKTKNKFWLDDYSLYMAIKKNLALCSWRNWDKGIRVREDKILKECRDKLSYEIDFWKFVQYEFFKQWMRLRAYANKNGIKIIGDIPIYVAEDSADIWANPKLFKTDKDLKLEVVSGCPPDAFTEDGQLWGNPIYDWKEHEKDGFKWWISRIKESFKLYDMVRIDHFRGFESYWEVPYGESTAKNGKWVKGPGIKLFNSVKSELGDLDIIAEDLGFLTDEVKEFKDKAGFPGMKVLEFAFGEEDSDYLPHNVDENCVYYIGTHDNETIVGWYNNIKNKKDREMAKDYFYINKEEGINFGFLRGVLSSRSKLVIMQMQDILGLGNEARMNEPSTLGCNWRFRIREEDLSENLSKKLLKVTKLYSRF
ncbi:4-alpha-glucanotransferase [Clostridium sardiniense]|uniref:4-alpha-glucanotransferase n=1 Tax=Clostridium sardiniense TaxID=29369 RepID=UPI00195CAEEA|nr:4-alpha-glucanotransferase [Clostridium sardiniense]MBM7836080.1 4-alpha-glucanotransferase [Clostridium sardiniense]